MNLGTRTRTTLARKAYTPRDTLRGDTVTDSRCSAGVVATVVLEHGDGNIPQIELDVDERLEDGAVAPTLAVVAAREDALRVDDVKEYFGGEGSA